MSALGQKQTFSDISAMSALPPKADIRTWPGVSALVAPFYSSGSLAMFTAIRRASSLLSNFVTQKLSAWV